MSHFSNSKSAKFLVNHLCSCRGTKSCTNFLDVCCNLPDVVKPEDKATPKPPEVSRPPSPAGKDCGKRNPDGLGSKKNGQTDNEARFGEFPWMVAILEVVESGTDGEKLNLYQCGGALIHRRAVMTAASCVEGLVRFSIQYSQHLVTFI